MFYLFGLSRIVTAKKASLHLPSFKFSFQFPAVILKKFPFLAR